MNEQKGIVYFVGAGPGDRGLMTVKGRRILAQAEVVLYDSLVNANILDCCSSDAEQICVGKRGGAPSLTQEEINNLLLEKARQGKRIVRLKGGDPFLFGRGGEEALILSRAGIPFQVVPGVPSAIAVPAYAGIPVTDRRYASSVAFITGHENPGKDRPIIAWQDIANGAETLVFLMGMRNLSTIVEQLIFNGRNPETPAAVIQQGTLGSQKVVAGTLDSICRIVEQHALKPPGIVVVGEVVKLRQELRWFETLPLFGRRIIITREYQEEDTLSELLEENGAEIVLFPTISFQPPDSYEEVDRAIAQLSDFQWIIFTSSNGVRYFMDRVWSLGKDVRSLSHLLFAAIGSGTARTLMNQYLKADLIPDEFSAEGVVRAFTQGNITGARILIPRAQQARDVLEQGLRPLQNDVLAVPVYKTVVPSALHQTEQFETVQNCDCIVFTSSSTVHNFFEYSTPAVLQELKDMAIACIGPITEGALRKHGFSAGIVPEKYDFTSLAEAIIKYYKELRSGGVKELRS